MEGVAAFRNDMGLLARQAVSEAQALTANGALFLAMFILC